MSDTVTTQGGAAPRTALRGYWERISETYAGADPLGAVCYPGGPPWLNRFFAEFQQRTVARMVRDLPVAGRRAVDVGCGTGRWTRWLAQRGARVVGVDPTAAMIESAQHASPELVFQRMSATALGFHDASFDLLLSITVIQHLTPNEQVQAVNELCRVVRPGGYVVTLDLIDSHDLGSVVYPRAPEDWIGCYRQCGMELQSWRGQEYVPLIRVLRRLGQWLHALRPAGGDRADACCASFIERTRSQRAFSLTYFGLWSVIQLSRLLEPVCDRVLPARLARHGCFVFRKLPVS